MKSSIADIGRALVPYLGRNTDAELAEAQAAITTCETEIARLDRMRAAALLATKGIAEIQEIDQKLQTQRGLINIHLDRITALKDRRKEEQRNTLERQKRAALATVEKRLTARLAKARELDAALKRAAELYAEFSNSRDAVVAGWSACLPIPAIADLSSYSAEFPQVLAYLKLLPWRGSVDQILRRQSAVGGPEIAPVIAEQHSRFLARLRDEPIALSLDHDEAMEDEEAA